MKYGYARVSTVHQDLQSQLNALEKGGTKRNIQHYINGKAMSINYTNIFYRVPF